jgi:hypothetical protein
MSTTPKFDTKATAQRTYERVLRYVRTKLANAAGFGVKEEVIGVPNPKSKKAPLVEALVEAEEKAWRVGAKASPYDSKTPARVEAYKAAFEEQAQAIATQFGLTYKPVGTTLRA